MIGKSVNPDDIVASVVGQCLTYNINSILFAFKHEKNITFHTRGLLIDDILNILVNVSKTSINDMINNHSEFSAPYKKAFSDLLADLEELIKKNNKRFAKFNIKK